MQELLAEFSSPAPLSPDTAAYLTERTRRLSLQPATAPSSESRSPQCSSLSPSGLSPSHHVHNRHHSLPDTPLHKNTVSVTPKSKLKLVIEGDSPHVSPIATSPLSRLPATGQMAVLYSTPHPTAVTKVTAMSTPHATSVVMEMSVLHEQEAELIEQEQRLEDQLQREAMERLRERISYIK